MRQAPRFRQYPEYKDSGIEWLGEIPAHWAVNRLHLTVTGCQNGLWGEETEGTHDRICVRVADFDRIRFRVSLDNPTLRSIEPGIAETRRLEQGDLLLEKSGGGERQPVGAVVIYEHDEPAVCSNFVARMPVADGYHPRYLTYLHAALYAARINTRSTKQSTGIQNLDSASYLRESVGLPNRHEQRVIADFLDRETSKTDALVEKKERLIELLQEKRTGLITRVVTRGLNPNVPMKDSGVEWLGEIPAHWDVVRSKALFIQRKENALHDDQQLTASQQYGVIPQSKFAELEGRQVVQVITGADILKHVEPNDFVISMRSFQGGLEHSKYRGRISSAYVAVCPSNRADVGYFSHLFKSTAYVQAIQSTSDLVRDGQALRFGNFAQVPLPLAPSQEQKEITNYLDERIARLDRLVGETGTAIRLLKEYRTALISASVTGKIDVREAASQ